MNRRLAVLSILALLARPARPAARGAAPAAAERPLTALPYTPSLDTVGDGPLGRSVRRLLHLLLRQVAGEEPDPRRPSRAGASTRKTGRRQPALPLGDAGGGRAARRPGATPTPRRSATTSPPAWTRRPSRRRGSPPLEARSGGHRRPEVQGGAGRPARPAAPRDGIAARCSSASAPARTPKDASQVIGFAAAGGLGLPSTARTT